MTTCRKRTDHRPMDGHDPKCANLRALPSIPEVDRHTRRIILQIRLRTQFIPRSGREIRRNHQRNKRAALDIEQLESPTMDLLSFPRYALGR